MPPFWICFLIWTVVYLALCICSGNCINVCLLFWLLCHHRTCGSQWGWRNTLPWKWVPGLCSATYRLNVQDFLISLCVALHFFQEPSCGTWFPALLPQIDLIQLSFMRLCFCFLLSDMKQSVISFPYLLHGSVSEPLRMALHCSTLTHTTTLLAYSSATDIFFLFPLISSLTHHLHYIQVDPNPQPSPPRWLGAPVTSLGFIIWK